VTAPDRTHAPAVAIIGVGPRGLTVLERLVALAAKRFAPAADRRNAGGAVSATDPALTIHLIDPYPPGTGIVWRTDQPESLLMNTTIAEQTVFPDSSCTFLDADEEPPARRWPNGMWPTAAPSRSTRRSPVAPSTAATSATAYARIRRTRTGLRRDRRTPHEGRIRHRPARHGSVRRGRCPPAGDPRRAAHQPADPGAENSLSAARTARRSSPRPSYSPSGISPAPSPRSAPGWPRSPNATADCTCPRDCRQRPPSPRWPPVTTSSSAAWGSTTSTCRPCSPMSAEGSTSRSPTASCAIEPSGARTAPGAGLTPRDPLPQQTDLPRSPEARTGRCATSPGQRRPAGGARRPRRRPFRRGPIQRSAVAAHPRRPAPGLLSHAVAGPTRGVRRRPRPAARGHRRGGVPSPDPPHLAGDPPAGGPGVRRDATEEAARQGRVTREAFAWSEIEEALVPGSGRSHVAARAAQPARRRTLRQPRAGRTRVPARMDARLPAHRSAQLSGRPDRQPREGPVPRAVAVTAAAQGTHRRRSHRPREHRYGDPRLVRRLRLRHLRRSSPTAHRRAPRPRRGRHRDLHRTRYAHRGEPCRARIHAAGPTGPRPNEIFTSHLGAGRRPRSPATSSSTRPHRRTPWPGPPMSCCTACSSAVSSRPRV
jgi:hypothetical protein